MARNAPAMAFTSLSHYIDIDLLRVAYKRTRRDGAVGVDDVTAARYGAALEANLQSLLNRFKAGTYRAPPVRRVHIPKGDGGTRPIGIPSFEDKVLQRAVAIVLGAVYEQDFQDCSYGFRPGRSPHQALDALGTGVMAMHGGYVLDVDIKGFFDTLVHARLREFLDMRVRDGVIRRTIGKWLNAGVLADGVFQHSEHGTPQGGVISPLLANVYLHHVLDRWFDEDVRPRLRGKAFLIRYADDFAIVCNMESDARRIMAVLPKRFAKYGLEIHPDKTRLVHFVRPSSWHTASRAETFDLLGLTLFWGRSRRRKWILRMVTSRKRFGRTLQRIRGWLREHRHAPVDVQWRRLSAFLEGHYQYFGVTGNIDALKRLAWETGRSWRKNLDRRSQKAKMTWERFNRLLERYPLPAPHLPHSYLKRSEAAR
jgi:group II intron reverse transcriptase/maturase